MTSEFHLKLFDQIGIPFSFHSCCFAATAQLQKVYHISNINSNSSQTADHFLNDEPSQIHYSL